MGIFQPVHVAFPTNLSKIPVKICIRGIRGDDHYYLEFKIPSYTFSGFIYLVTAID
jgi:hypothetical protein